jgi:glycine cleavage system transcriptional repressor
MATKPEDRARWLMLTVVGADRAGIVAQLTEALYRGGCNLGEASMARLGGNFTVMLMVEGADAATLERLLRPVTEGLGLRLHVDQIEGALYSRQEPNVQVTVYGADRPGIVAQVTGALSAAGFNILDLNSDVGGTRERPMYVMIIDGLAEGGAAAAERALAPLRAGGIDVHVTALEPMIG